MGLEVIGVAVDDGKAGPKRLIDEQKLTFPNIVEGIGFRSPVFNAWGVIHVPVSFLIDRDGKVVAMDMKPEELEPAIAKLVEKKD